MKPAGYRDIPPGDIPDVALPGGGTVKVIAGAVEVQGHTTRGPVQGLSTEPQFLDVALPAGAVFEHALPEGHSTFVYVYEGAAAIGPASERRSVSAHEAAVLSDGGSVTAAAGESGARFLLLAAKPLREPVVQYGPFVMNTQEEIEQAIRDYQTGSFA
jgi:redox-sensitive bicupin YhaK (pirin superfamily)